MHVDYVGIQSVNLEAKFVEEMMVYLNFIKGLQRKRGESLGGNCICPQPLKLAHQKS